MDIAMDKKTLIRRATILKALANPSRLMIVQELHQGRRCVCELTELVGNDISTVSRHLSQLKKAGLIVDHKEGNWVYYELCCPCIVDFIECLDKMSGKKPLSSPGTCNCA